MELLRRYLTLISRTYLASPKRLFGVAGVASVGLIGLTLLADAVLPFDAWWGMTLRSALLVPTTLAVFALCYGVAVATHRARVAADAAWIPFRYRLSRAWRLRVSAIVGAFLVVLAVASHQQVGYTFIAVLIMTVALGLLAYIRSTKEEIARDRAGVMDPRDMLFNSQYKRFQREREAEKARRTKARRAKRDEASQPQASPRKPL